MNGGATALSEVFLIAWGRIIRSKLSSEAWFGVGWQKGEDLGGSHAC